MRTTGKPPAWAVRLVEDACAAEGVAPPAELTWSRRHERFHFRAVLPPDDRHGLPERIATASRKEPLVARGATEVKRVAQPGSDASSSGRCWGTERIHVTAGKSRDDQRIVLAHEIAHHLNHGAGGHGHEPAFWAALARVFRRFPGRMPTRAYAVKREGRNFARALRAASPGGHGSEP